MQKSDEPKEKSKGWQREWCEVLGSILFFFLVWSRSARGLSIFTPGHGILPWLYKEEWGGGWKKVLFAAGYAAVETGIAYLLFSLGDNGSGWIFYSCVYVLFCLMAIFPVQEGYNDESEADGQEEKSETKEQG